jgi:hypothetical protein
VRLNIRDASAIQTDGGGSRSKHAEQATCAVRSLGKRQAENGGKISDGKAWIYDQAAVEFTHVIKQVSNGIYQSFPKQGGFKRRNCIETFAEADGTAPVIQMNTDCHS